MNEMNDEKKLYPVLTPEWSLHPELAILPEDRKISSENRSEVVMNPDNFRLKQVGEVKTFFEGEIEYRRKLFSKYKKAYDVITGINHGLNVTSAISGSVGITALAGVITAPVGLALGGVTIGSAIASSLIGWQKKNIFKKLSKHEKVYTLAISKLNTVNELVSKALIDSRISDQEFSLILKEKEKYISLKNNMRRENIQTSSKVDVEALKKTFLEEGKKLAQNELLDKLRKT